MKIGNIDFCKIKKITAIEIVVLIIVFVAIGIYYSPNIITKKEMQKIAKIKADNAIFTSKALEEFSANKKAKPSEVAKKIAQELNTTSKNPFDEKSPAYTFETICTGCNNIEFDDKLQMIILSAYNKKGELMARTVIKPPSFVTYAKEFNKKKK